MTRAPFVVAVVTVASSFACACGDDHAVKVVPPKYAEVAEIHHAQCGNCHTRVEPGERTRARFEAAMSRHHARVKMNDAEWALLIDYLSQTP